MWFENLELIDPHNILKVESVILIQNQTSHRKDVNQKIYFRVFIGNPRQHRKLDYQDQIFF